MGVRLDFPAGTLYVLVIGLPPCSPYVVIISYPTFPSFACEGATERFHSNVLPLLPVLNNVSYVGISICGGWWGGLVGWAGCYTIYVVIFINQFFCHYIIYR